MFLKPGNPGILIDRQNLIALNREAVGFLLGASPMFGGNTNVDHAGNVNCALESLTELRVIVSIKSLSES